MIKRIYHGSKNRIEQPIYGYGKTYNDYGIGFYCTESLDMAKEWAVDIDSDGFANKYDLNMDGLSILDLNSTSYCMLHWLTILIQNREFDTPSIIAKEAKDYLIKNFSINYSKYDVIIGYRADDSYFSFALDFITGTISYRQLCNAMHLGKLGKQIVLKSKKAFNQIKFIDSEIARSDEWFAKKQIRRRNAKHDYFNVEKNKRRKDDIFITQIIDEEMKANDERLR